MNFYLWEFHQLKFFEVCVKKCISSEKSYFCYYWELEHCQPCPLQLTIGLRVSGTEGTTNVCLEHIWGIWGGVLWCESLQSGSCTFLALSFVLTFCVFQTYWTTWVATTLSTGLDSLSCFALKKSNGWFFKGYLVLLTAVIFASISYNVPFLLEGELCSGPHFRRKMSRKTQFEQVITHRYYQFLPQASLLIIANLGSLISTFQNIVLQFIARVHITIFKTSFPL